MHTPSKMIFDTILLVTLLTVLAVIPIVTRHTLQRGIQHLFAQHLEVIKSELQERATEIAATRQTIS